ncbi:MULTISPECIES: hypothetical protein [unclassified Bradyrhizobium]|uniref:hypothetical protein n=1 Tax=Bradyrhizobium TaxID=374 RepID=UPI0028F08EDC|nr:MULTISPECIES: hypothetical protein [unclassified Bradyrhizobium]
MNFRTPRVFAIFLLGGTLISAPVIWLTGPLLLQVERPREGAVVDLFAAFALSLAWILPAQLFVATAAALQVSFSKRISWPFALFFVIPVAALTITYRDIVDCCDRLVPSDVQKLLYWTMVVTPAELICAWYVSKMSFPLDHQQLPAGER